MKYIIKQFNQTDFTDSYGNKGFNVVFEGNETIPVFWLTKKEVSKGMEVEGEIKDVPKKNKPNETYKRFFSAKQSTDLTPITEQLDRIEKKLDNMNSLLNIQSEDEPNLSDIPL